MNPEHEDQNDEEIEEPVANTVEESREPDYVEAMQGRLTIAEQELADTQTALHERDEQLGALQAEQAELVDISNQFKFLTSDRFDEFKRTCVARIHRIIRSRTQQLLSACVSHQWEISYIDQVCTW